MKVAVFMDKMFVVETNVYQCLNVVRTCASPEAEKKGIHRGLFRK